MTRLLDLWRRCRLRTPNLTRPHNTTAAPYLTPFAPSPPKLRLVWSTPSQPPSILVARGSSLLLESRAKPPAAASRPPVFNMSSKYFQPLSGQGDFTDYHRITPPSSSSPQELVPRSSIGKRGTSQSKKVERDGSRFAESQFLLPPDRPRARASSPSPTRRRGVSPGPSLAKQERGRIRYPTSSQRGQLSRGSPSPPPSSHRISNRRPQSSPYDHDPRRSFSVPRPSATPPPRPNDSRRSSSNPRSPTTLPPLKSRKIAAERLGIDVKIQIPISSASGGTVVRFPVSLLRGSSPLTVYRTMDDFHHLDRDFRLENVGHIVPSLDAFLAKVEKGGVLSVDGVDVAERSREVVEALQNWLFDAVSGSTLNGNRLPSSSELAKVRSSAALASFFHHE